MIIISDYLCTRVHLYTVVIYTDGTIMDMCPYLLLVANYLISHWLGILIYDMHLCRYFVIMDIFMSVLKSS